MKASEVLDNLKRRFPNEPEYHQAVSEVLGTIEEVYNEHPEFASFTGECSRVFLSQFFIHSVHIADFASANTYITCGNIRVRADMTP